MLGLRTSAEFFGKHGFYVWDRDTNTFSDEPEFSARLGTVDRFVTIYHLPTRLRNLYITPEEVLPDSLVIKAASGDIYIVSATNRVDSIFGDNYSAQVASRCVNPPSGGLAELFRPGVSGSGIDLGAVSLTEVGSEYVDLALRTTTGENNLPTEQEGDYVATFSATSGVQDDDIFLLNGASYWLTEVYPEAGFLFSRCVKNQVGYTNYYYEYNAIDGYHYDTTTGRISGVSSTSLAFSAIRLRDSIRRTEETDNFHDRLALSVKLVHVGFTFKVGNRVLDQADTYVIKSIAYSKKNTHAIVFCDRVPR